MIKIVYGRERVRNGNVLGKWGKNLGNGEVSHGR